MPKPTEETVHPGDLANRLHILLNSPKSPIHAPSKAKAPADGLRPEEKTLTFDEFFEQIFSKEVDGTIHIQDRQLEKEARPASFRDLKQLLSAIHNVWDEKATDKELDGLIVLEWALPEVKPVSKLSFASSAMGTTGITPENHKITTFHIFIEERNPLARFVQLSEWFNTLFTIPLGLFDTYFGMVFQDPLDGLIVDQESTQKAKFNQIKSEILAIRKKWTPQNLGWKFKAFRKEGQGIWKNKFSVAFEWDHPYAESGTRVGFEAQDSIVDWSQKLITKIELAPYDFSQEFEEGAKATAASSPKPDEE